MADIETFEPDGRAIPYAEDRRNGPSLVLVPGQGLNIGYLGPLAEALAEEDFHVVRIGSRLPQSGAEPTMHDLAEDVIDVMDHLDLAFPWVGGHGFGGSVARIASIDHPGRFGGLLLLGAASFFTAAGLPTPACTFWISSVLLRSTESRSTTTLGCLVALSALFASLYFFTSKKETLLRATALKPAGKWLAPFFSEDASPVLDADPRLACASVPLARQGAL